MVHIFRFVEEQLKMKLKVILLILIVCFLNFSLTYSSSFPKGYLIFVSMETYEISKYGAISTTDEAIKIFDYINGYQPNTGIAYLPLYFSPKDIEVHKKIAQIAVSKKIDIWLSSYNLIKRIRAFGNIKPEYYAYYLDDDGKIVQAFLDQKPLFDILNPDAVDWFIKLYKTKYLLPMKGLYKGYIFDEDVLPYLDKRKNGEFFDYRKIPTFSDSVLKQWQKYCIRNNITYNGKIVDKFPVHDAELEKNGKGKTQFFPGYNVPIQIESGQSYSEMPKVNGVWEHWFEFLNHLFIANWLEKIAKAVIETNKDNDEFYGIAYLSFFEWNIPYEKISEHNFRVTKKLWGAWGRQRYADITEIAKSDLIDFIICETYPPLEADIENYIDFFKKITFQNNKIFGLQLHRDDNWKININEETKRWHMINKFKPDIIVRYPLKSILPDNKYYSDEIEIFFKKQLKEYRNSYEK